MYQMFSHVSLEFLKTLYYRQGENLKPQEIKTIFKAVGIFIGSTKQTYTLYKNTLETNDMYTHEKFRNEPCLIFLENILLVFLVIDYRS